MTKEEYFLTEWVHDDCDSRAVDGDGSEYYYGSLPIISFSDISENEGVWAQNWKRRDFYKREQVINWWNVSLQTYEEYLELMAAKIMTNE
jgi:carbohydrate-binding DOMON domain-containing protein